MSQREIKSGGTMYNTGSLLDRTKTYTYDSNGNIVEVDGVIVTLGDNDLVFSGSKSNLRRMADLERNVSILATRMYDGSLFTGNVVFSPSSIVDVQGSFDVSGTLGTNFTEKLQDIMGSMVTSNTESGITVTYDDTLGKLNFSVTDSFVNTTGDTMSGVLNMGGNLIQNLATPLISTDAASKGYVDSAVSSEVANVAQYTSWFFSDGTNLSEIVDGGSLVINPGNNISIAYNATTDEYTINSTDTNTTYSAGSGLTLSGTTFSHTDTSSVTNLTASGRTYVTGLTFDTFGHVTGVTTGTETVVNTDTNNYLTGLALTTGTLTATRSGLTDVTVDLSPLTTGLASTTYVDTAISNLVNGASSAFDTLKEIQDAMATDAELASAIANITVGDATITIAAGSGLTTGGSFTTNATSNSTITLSHADTSTATSLTASGRRYVTGLTFDTYGHVTGYTTGTETVTDTNDIDYINAASFNTTTGVLTLSGVGNAGATVDLDGRYALSGHTHNYDNYVSWNISDGTNSEGITSGGTLKVVGSGASSTSYDAATNTLTISSTDTNTDTNNYVTGLSFNTTDGVLTATRSGLGNLTVDLDGRYQLAGSYLTSESDTLNTVTTRGNSTSNTITVGALNVTTNAVITGNLTVQGSVTTINTEEINLADNIIILNSNETGTPTQNAGIEVERGTETNVSLLWDETNDTWTVGSASITAGQFIGSFQGTSTESTTANVANAWAVARTLTLNGAVTGSVAWDGSANVSMTTSLGSALDNYVQWIAQDGDGTTYTITSQDSLIFNEGGGIDINFTADDTLTFSHADTSTAANLAASGRRYVTGLTFDTYGHVTGYTTGTETVVNTDTTYTAGAGISLTGTEFSVAGGAGLVAGSTGLSHADTSTQASVNNSNGTVIQDVTLDGFGHVTGLASVDLDTRYLNNSTGLTIDVNAANGTQLFLGSTATWTNAGPKSNNAGGLLSLNTHPGNYYSQLWFDTAGNGIYHRTASGTLPTATWQRLFADDYHPNADKLTTARNIALTGAVTGNANFDGSGNISISTTATSDPTLTINGDASGSATFTNLGNATLTLTIADDSHNHVISNVDGLQAALDAKLDDSQKGAVNGLAELDATGKVPSSQLPSFVDDVLEYAAQANFPVTGETGKLYVALDTNDVYRWSGSAYIKVSDAVSTADTATKLTTARNIALTGDVTGSANFDGSANISITATIADDSHNHTIANVDGLQVALDGKLATTGKAADSNLLDGLDSTAFFRANTSNSVDARFAAGNGRGVRFWDSDQYKIWMSNATDATWGGRLDSTSDYNMYFRMTGGTNRGFVFQNNTTEVFQVESTGQTRQTGNAYVNTSQRVFADDYHPNADKLTTARNIALTGDVTGSANFDGSANISITATIADDSHNHIIANVDGLQVALDGKLNLSGGTMTGALTVPNVIATSNGTGTAYKVGDDAYIGDVNVVNTLNVSGVQNSDRGYISFGNSTGQLGRIGTGALTWIGNAIFHDGYHPNADKLTTARNIALAGDVTGSANFDGSANISITATIADDSHNHIIANVDGLQAALDAKLAASSYTAADVLAKIKTVDGAGSGLDADLLDGISSASFLRGDVADTFTTLTGSSLDVSGELEGEYIGVGNTSATTGYGVSLYGGGVAGQPTYGIMFAGTPTFGTHGSVTGDWATYFTMNNTANRGWVFRQMSTGVNVASINNAGHATFNGNVTATNFVGVASQAKYSDLAERYETDGANEPGTIMVFGGEKEITSSTKFAQTKIAGVISTKPAVMMNSEAGSDETHPYIALQGRVPCKVVGKVRKGDIIVASEYKGVGQAWVNEDIDPRMTAYVGIAIEDKHTEGEGLIEVKVGK